MSENATKTLFHPFENGTLPVPGAKQRALFLGAVPGFRLPDGFAANLQAVQGFRPDFLALDRHGVAVTPEPQGDGYDLALVLLGRHRGQNEARIAEAYARTKNGGLVLVAGGKKDGVDSLRKRLGKLIALDGSLSKHHGIAFWFARAEAAAPVMAELAFSGRAVTVDGRFRAAPGMFSHDRIDPASRLLADHLPQDLAGRAADFGAGWGYLAAALLERAGQHLSGLDLYEADHAALEAAKTNLASQAGRTPLGFHWRDLLSEPVPRHYDVVVMNPPFHHGRAAEPAIGTGMIRAASAALKPGGRLFLVANRGLPYETDLAAMFATSGETLRDTRFKLLWARR
ncbi:class I SAM-dependent methyltransferase [Nitratireductor sp. StC3]|uniref:class I SAM-dependent methyltransferase n=1 Tax=Nitratireductor sp. StC3 TaxID=2126741 RepID=UPI000D0DD90C|nr:class I SAM-dependent methyltransferase [Nitratireductor sp. StC3]PSM16848.1 methyltransferase [Nitratireductor sp. StC3]